ncbi:reverse transcriptase [Gossypium australe]|uniref:Reverse transcriptase n=1 Tax=Gossypium australe TaxID=47621 RepID=A0A5B6U2W7_9ROSI|nr:reverse transcriptase [Gossypium australe]
MEAKLCRIQTERVRRSCGFVNGIEVGRGGLCLAWRNDINVTLQSFSKRHIDVIVEDTEINDKWRFTGFYGTPYAQDREDSWAVLKNLYYDEDIPWFVCGDFNEIMYGFEEKGGLPRDKRRMESFRKTLEECQLNDVGFFGRWFTWERRNLPETNIQERLDMGVANVKLMLMSPEAKIQHLVHSFSDHCPLLVVTKREDERRKGNNFKIEAWWTLEDSFVDEAGQIRTNRKRRKEVLTAKLSDLEKAERDDRNLAVLIDTEIQLNFEIEKDEYYWEQRARLNWLKSGDRNTTFFIA